MSGTSAASVSTPLPCEGGWIRTSTYSDMPVIFILILRC